MYERINFSENRRGAMTVVHQFEGAGPLVHMLATDLGQIGVQYLSQAEMYLQVEPFSAAAAAVLHGALIGWAPPELSGGIMRRCFSLRSPADAFWRDKAKHAIRALLSGDGVVYTWSKPGNQILWVEELVSAARRQASGFSPSTSAPLRSRRLS